MDLGQLLDQVEDLSPAEPARALHLAAEAVDRIEEGTFRVQSRAWLLWGNLRRVFGQWVDAERAFYCSACLLRRGAPVSADWLPWYQRIALLRRDQRQLPEAEAFVDRAVEICRQQRNPGAALGRALTYQAIVRRISSLERAAPCARAALQLLPPDDRPFRRSAVHVVLACLSYGNADPAELRLWLRQAREFNDPPDSYAGRKLTWFEGLAHARAGRYEAAVSALETARAGILPIHGGVAAICAMDQALIHLEAGDNEAARVLAGQLFPIFQALRTSREATAALALYVSAAGRGALTADLVREIRQRIEAAPIPPNFPQKTVRPRSDRPAAGQLIRL